MKKRLMVALLTLLAACSKTEINEDIISGNHPDGYKGIAGSNIDSDGDNYDGPTILGKKIANIYSVKNLISARGSLGPSATNYLTIPAIKGTHVYIRFLPADDEEYCELLDKGYELFTEPLDYEIEKSGWYYHDPGIADTLYTWQYTTLPINTVLPAVKYEILDTMCIMESPSGPSGPTPPGVLTYEIWEKLVSESGNFLGIDAKEYGHTGTPNYTSGPPGAPGAPGTRWRPSGRIMVYDYLLQKYIPVEGLKISITDGYKHAKAVTQADGTFFCRQVVHIQGMVPNKVGK